MKSKSALKSQAKHSQAWSPKSVTFTCKLALLESNSVQPQSLHNSFVCSYKPTQTLHNSFVCGYKLTQILHNSFVCSYKPTQTLHNSFVCGYKPTQTLHNSFVCSYKLIQTLHNSFGCGYKLTQILHNSFVCSYKLIQTLHNSFGCGYKPTQTLHNSFVCSYKLIQTLHNSFVCGYKLIQTLHNSFVCGYKLIQTLHSSTVCGYTLRSLACTHPQCSVFQISTNMCHQLLLCFLKAWYNTPLLSWTQKPQTLKLTWLDAAGGGSVVTELAQGAEGKVTIRAVAHVAVVVLDHRMLTQPPRAVHNVHHRGQRGLQQEFVVALILFIRHQLLDLQTTVPLSVSGWILQEQTNKGSQTAPQNGWGWGWGWWSGTLKSQCPSAQESRICPKSIFRTAQPFVTKFRFSWTSPNPFICYKYNNTGLVILRGGDSSVVRAPNSWLKGRGFESLLERRENFLLQGRLSVLTLISVSVPPPCYRSST